MMFASTRVLGFYRLSPDGRGDVGVCPYLSRSTGMFCALNYCRFNSDRWLPW